MELEWHVNDLTGTRQIVRGKNLIHVPVNQGEVLTRVEAKLTVPPARKMFFNGYQTWTHCPEYRQSDRIRGLHGLPKIGVTLFALDRFADYHFIDYPNQKGILHGFSYCYFREGKHYRLFASLDEKPGYTIFTYESSGSTLRIERDCRKVSVQEIPFPAFSIFYAEGTEQEVFDSWFSALEIRSHAPAVKGYSSWYNRYQHIDQKSIQEDLAGAAKLFEPGDLFQIDDGWERFVGDWDTADRKKFPNGLRPVAAKIHESGFQAGLWLAPFVCEKKSGLFKEHPDWLLRYRGRPWKDGPNWGGHYSLDIDNPEFTAWLKSVFDRVFDEWGFDLVKLDFLYGAAPFPTGDHGLPTDAPFSESRAARMIRAMAFLRECCRDKLILGCGVPVMPAFGLVDYCRVGCDVGLDWDDFPLMRVIHRERVSTRQSLNNTIFRRQLNGRAYGSDPDVFFLREKNISLSEAEKTYLASADALFGSVWLTSDDLNSYTESKAARYRELARLRDAVDVSIDPDTLTIRYTLDGTEHILPYPHPGQRK